MKKRIVSMILALSMLLSILPVSAFADVGSSSAAANNDGETIEVKHTTGKLPFKGYTEDYPEGFIARDFGYVQNENGTYMLTCRKEGVGKEDVGKLTFEYKCITGVNAGTALPVDTFPMPGAPYGRYQVVITAEEGEKYEAGSIVVSEEAVRYAPVAADFTYDAAQHKATYTGKNYYGADPTQVTVLYTPEGTVSYNADVPTTHGRYDVHVMVYEDANYSSSLTETVCTFVVADPGKPTTYILNVDGATTEHAEGEEIIVTAPEKEGCTFAGWDATGLPSGVDTTKATIRFKMPANDVKLAAKIIPTPAPDPKPDPEPDPEPAPDPKPDPKPDPEPAPDPKPDPKPDPEPTPDPKPDPEPAPDPKPDPDPAPAPSDDGSGAVVVAAAAVGGAAVGVGIYIASTTAYLKSVLPEGVAIPADRQQLAVALWTAAGKPATQSTALFSDVAADAAELQAIRWAVDTGLMTAQDGSFKPGNRVSRLEVIRTWKSYQKRG